MLAGTLLWVAPLLKPLFQGGGGRGMASNPLPEIFPSSPWIGFLLWGLAAGVTFVCLQLLGTTSPRKWLSSKNQVQIVYVLLALLVLAIAATAASYIG